jgi:predicted amidohydrolase YtcJ
MKSADRDGFQLFIHAIGDRAIAQVLCAYRKMGISENPLRHRVEHLELATRSQMKEMKRMNLLASMQPNFVRWQGTKGMYEKILGVRRKRMANRIGDLRTLGVPVAFGSDCMPLSPLVGIESACRHPEQSQRISVEEAIRTYTLGSAYASFDEDLKGSLEPGKLADVAILSGSVSRLADLRKLRVEGTIVGGRIVYMSPELEASGPGRT